MRALRWIHVVVAGMAMTSGAPALAATWVYISTSSSDSDRYYDADSIRRSGNQVTVWQKLDHSRDKKERARQTLTLRRYDCANRTSTLISATAYFPDGTVESYTWDASEQEADPIVPDSMAEQTLNAICIAR